MTQRVQPNASLRKVLFFDDDPKRALNTAVAHRPGRRADQAKVRSRRKHQSNVAMRLPVFSQQLNGDGGNGHDAILPALAVANMNLPASRMNVTWLHLRRIAQPQPTRIT